MIIYRFLFHYACSFYDHFDKDTGEAMAIGLISIMQATVLMSLFFIAKKLLNLNVPVIPKYVIVVLMLALIVANTLYLLYFVGKQKITDTISQYSFKKKQLYAMVVLAHLLLSVCLPVVAFHIRK
jgi:hypothetical protein